MTHPNYLPNFKGQSNETSGTRKPYQTQGMNRRTIYFLYWATAITYLVAHTYFPFTGEPIIKAMPAMFMSALLFSARDRRLIPIAAGFYFAATGDILLGVSDAKYFIYGLAAFALAHIGYSLTLYQFLKRQHISILKILLILGFDLVASVFIVPNLGELKLPVLIYSTLITTMAFLASTAAPGFSVVYLGALSFMFSDTIFTVNKFIVPIPNAELAIMPTYYLGQFLIGYHLTSPQSEKLS